MAGGGHNFFFSVQRESQNFLGAFFKKLVALPPPPSPLNNDTSLKQVGKYDTILPTRGQGMKGENGSDLGTLMFEASSTVSPIITNLNSQQ